MNNRGIAAIGVAAVALLVLLGGCGGDGETTAASIDKQQFVKRANAICKDGVQQIRARFQRANNEIEARQQALSESERNEELIEVFAPPYEREIAELSDLPPPSGDDQAIAELVEAMEAALQEVEEDPSKLGTSSRQFMEVNEVSSKYGLEDCVL